MEPDGARYLAAFRRAAAASPESRDRNREAIAARLAAGETIDAEDEDDDERVPAPPRGRWAAALFMCKAVSLSVGLGVAGLGVIKVGAMTWAAATREQAAPASETEPEREPEPAAVVDEPRRAAVRSSDVPQVDTPEIATSSSEPPPVPARVSKPRAKAKASDRLREEVDLLTRAREQLDAGHHADVLRLVAEHERRFPDGQMIEERRAWRAIAMCSLRRADARAEADAFLAGHPRSPQAEKVRRACSDRMTDPSSRSD